MKMHPVLPAFVLAAGFMFASEAPASMIASDSFSTAGGAGTYNTGTVYGQNPTVGLSGFSGAWGNSNTQTTGDIAAQTGGLSHVLVTGGTQAGSLTSAGGATGTRGVYHQLTSVPNSSTYYFSFLMSSAGSRVASLGLRQQGAHDTAVSNTSLGGVSVGFSGSNIVAWVNGSATTILTGFTTDSTYFALVEILNNGVGFDDTVNVKIYNSGNTNLASPDAQQSITTQDVTGKLTHLAAIKSTGTTGVHASLDEFRFGTTLADVAIPEPASLALMGLGGLLMLSRSRRD